MRERRGVSYRAFRTKGAMIGVEGYPCGWCRKRAEKELTATFSAARMRREELNEALAQYEAFKDAMFYR